MHQESYASANPKDHDRVMGKRHKVSLLFVLIAVFLFPYFLCLSNFLYSLFQVKEGGYDGKVNETVNVVTHKT